MTTTSHIQMNLTDFKKGSGLTCQTLTSVPHERPSNQTLTKNPQKLCYFFRLTLTTNPQLDWQTLKNFDYPFFVMKFQLEFLNCEIIDYFFIFALEPTPLDFKSFLYAFNFFFGTLMVALE